MSLIGSEILAGASGQAGAAGYQIEQSLRFNSADSANLSRTPSSTGNRKTFTVSCWVKRAQLGATQMIWSAGPASGGNIYLYFTSSDELQLSVDTEASGIVKTTQKFRDTSAWYHIVCAVDTSQATAANRVKFFINGDAVSAFASASYPSQNHDTHWNHTSGHRIGQRNDGTAFYINAYIAEFYNLDGTAVSDAEDFAEADDNGVWRPIETSGLTYGTNGFYLNFSNSSDLGEDQAGSNDWTPSGFSTTAGSSYDVMSDTPTTNWCTLNPLYNHQSRSEPVLSNGNLDASNNGGGDDQTHGTIGVNTGKFYFEYVVTAGVGSQNGFVGWQHNDPTINGGSVVSGQYRNNGTKYLFNNTSASTGVSWTNDDVIGCAVDADAGKIWFAKNNTWIQSGDPAAGSNATLTYTTTDEYIFPSIGFDNTATTVNGTVNFGQRAFEYTPPTGFKALNTSNLPEPDIADGSDYFQTVLYTGTNSSQDITVADNSGNTWGPDFVWIKPRNLADRHRQNDIIRGANRTLSSESTEAEYGPTNAYLDSFNTDGFTISGSDGGWNNSSYNYVSWNWLAANGTETLTAGSVNSTVSANPTAGFSIVSYQSQTATKPITLAHGLGVKPSMIICKNRDASSAWTVYHSALGATKAIFLNSLNTPVTSADYWNDTEPTDTVFTVNDSTGTHAYGTSNDMIAYCFAEVEGYSKFGKFDTNNTSDNTFVYLGFKPAMIIVKIVDTAADNWLILDNKRNNTTDFGGNPIYEKLEPNTNSAASTATTTEWCDFLSNGFKVRTNNGQIGGGPNYIYAAFAEHPTGGSGVSPATAR